MTLKAIGEDPVRADIEWRDVESLLNALGAEITEGNGWRVRFSLNGVRAVFHEPHPEKEMKKGAIRSLSVSGGQGPSHFRGGHLSRPRPLDCGPGSRFNFSAFLKNLLDDARNSKNIAT